MARTGYLGQLRVAARIYRQRPSTAAMGLVLDGSEQFRSRQLMEQLGTEVTRITSLEQARQGLGPGDGVLMFNDLESHLLSVVFSRHGHHLTLVERPPGWNQSLFAIRNRLAEEYTFDQAALAALTRPLLAELETPLRQADALYILTDGALSALPASILPLPGGGLLQGERPLTYLPSLALMNPAERRDAAAPRSLLALGDPVFNSEEVIEEQLGRKLVATTRSVGSLHYLTPLPETRTEVEAIIGILDGGDALLGAEASLGRLRSFDLSSYRYLHFATHGVLGDEIPMVGEPALVLAHERGSPSFLTASEVSGMQLNAEIAVLSACNTGNGEYYRGEGLLGLGRAFMVAGARQVVVSLWPVDSHATERLMVAFYVALGEGLGAASALARAQHELQSQPMPGEQSAGLRGLQRTATAEKHYDDYRNPFFWSPFVLIGG